MCGKMAMEDIEALMAEGCVIQPEDVVRLNALSLKLEKRPDFRLSTLPRVALCGGVMFTQPTIEQEMYIDKMMQVFSHDEGTKIALDAYVLAHPDQDWSKTPTFPRVFAAKCSAWIKVNLGKETVSKIRAAIDYVKTGCNPADGEYPVYMTDETFDKWYYSTGPKSAAMRQYLRACSYGIAPFSALKATSPQLAAMIERAAILQDMNIGDEEKELAAQYFATLAEIKKDAYARRDEKTTKDVKNG